ncbi:Carbonic_anhydrase [Hexamita inflata]|uniref:Carbonic anhydrase n=1 Tax=Hexamita inflata TaxID=28002 RepID=A0AA86P5D3_9EUKA|nr:Carbonic anhydrase [Hexamita inflata]
MGSGITQQAPSQQANVTITNQHKVVSNPVHGLVHSQYMKNMKKYGEQPSGAQLVQSLIHGNEYYRKNELYADQRDQTKSGQTPSFIIVSCSDSRCSVPLLFNRPHLGAIFEIKSAGNCLDATGIESIKYAIEHIEPPPKLIVVMGHTKCGAVTACYNSICQEKHHKLRMEFPSILTTIMEPTRHNIEKFGTGNKDKVLAEISEDNAKKQAQKVQFVFDEVLEKYGISVYAGMYDIDTGDVKFLKITDPDPKNDMTKQELEEMAKEAKQESSSGEK